MATIAQLKDDRKKLLEQTSALHKEAGGFKGETHTTEQVATFQQNMEALRTVGAEIEKAEKAQADALKLAAEFEAGELSAKAQRDGGSGAPSNALSYQPGHVPGTQPAFIKSVGDFFMESVGVKNYSKDDQKGPPVQVDLKTVFQTTTANSIAVGYPIEILRNGEVVEIAQRKPKMDMVIPISRTTLPSVLYLRETLNTNGAGFVHEDDPRPMESAFKLEEDTATVKKLRVSIPIADDMLEDAPYMVDYINNRLRVQLALAKDQALINGDGTGDNLLGLLLQPGIQTDTVTNLGPAKTDAVHRAITSVLVTSEYEADTVVMHPLDLQEIRLTKTTDGAYLYANPNDTRELQLWGMKTISTKGMPQHTSLIGAFDVACTQAIRRDVTMSISTQHEDYWMRGRLGIKLEMRLALVVYRPSALFKLTGV